MLWETALLCCHHPSPRFYKLAQWKVKLLVVFTAIVFASNCTRYTVLQFLGHNCSFILY